MPSLLLFFHCRYSNKISQFHFCTDWKWNDAHSTSDVKKNFYFPTSIKQTKTICWYNLIRLLLVYFFFFLFRFRFCAKGENHRCWITDFCLLSIFPNETQMNAKNSSHNKKKIRKKNVKCCLASFFQLWSSFDHAHWLCALSLVIFFRCFHLQFCTTFILIFYLYFLLNPLFLSLHAKLCTFILFLFRLNNFHSLLKLYEDCFDPSFLFVHFYEFTIIIIIIFYPVMIFFFYSLRILI